jgi:hypothetical protein
MALSSEINNKFKSDLEAVDLADLGLLKDLVSSEITQLSQAWSTLREIAPAVNESLKALIASSIRERIGAVLTELSRIESTSSAAFTNALLATSGANVTAVMDDLYGKVKTAAETGSELQTQIYNSYNRDNDLLVLASSMQTLGSSMLSVSKASGAMTSEVAASAQKTTVAAQAEKSGASSTTAISLDAVTQLLAVFQSKKLAVDSKSDEARQALLGQKASLQNMLQIWKSVFASSVNGTNAGYAAISALGEAVNKDLNDKITRDEAVVLQKLATADSVAIAQRDRLQSARNINKPILASVKKRLVEINDVMNVTLPKNISEYDDSMRKDIGNLEALSTSFGDSISGAVGDWSFNLRNAIQSYLTDLKA